MVTKTSNLLKNMKNREQRFEPKTPIASDMFIPNLSGIKSHPEALAGFWTADTNQTGLTGNKTGSFDLTTTGDIKLGGVASIGQDLDNLEFTDVSGSANVDWIGFGIMDFGAADITNVQDITSSQTIQAEHLYSTDDLVVDDDIIMTGNMSFFIDSGGRSTIEGASGNLVITAEPNGSADLLFGYDVDGLGGMDDFIFYKNQTVIARINQDGSYIGDANMEIGAAVGSGTTYTLKINGGQNADAQIIFTEGVNIRHYVGYDGSENLFKIAFGSLSADPAISIDNSDNVKVKNLRSEGQLDLNGHFNINSNNTDFILKDNSGTALEIGVNAETQHMTFDTTNTTEKTIFGYDVDLLANDLTTTGTIQGEQITSTDDINAAGLITNTMSVSDTKGLFIDGGTNDYTGTSAYTAFQIDADVATPSGTSVFNVKGTDSNVINSHTITGTGASAPINYGINNELTVSGEHSVDAFVVDEENYANKVVMRRSGTVTSDGTISNRYINYGTHITILDSMDYNNNGKSVDVSNYGGYFLVSQTGEETAGTVTRTNYGNYITVSGNASGTTTNYGLYIASISGADTNYAIYDASGKDWVLDGDNQKIQIGETNTDLEIYSDGTDACIDFTGGLKINGAAGASGNFTTTDGKTVTVVDGLITAIV